MHKSTKTIMVADSFCGWLNKWSIFGFHGHLHQISFLLIECIL